MTEEEATRFEFVLQEIRDRPDLVRQVTGDGDLLDEDIDELIALFLAVVDSDISILLGELVLAGQDVSVESDSDITIPLGELALTGEVVSVSADSDVAVLLGELALTGEDVSVSVE